MFFAARIFSTAPQVETIKISDDDAAFILGKGGKTKEKLLDSTSLWIHMSFE